MRPVSVRIMHPEPAAEAEPLTRWVAGRRAVLAERQCAAFRLAGAADVAIVSGPPDDLPYGGRVRALVRAERPAGLVVLGSGAIPLATRGDRAAFVEAAGDPDRVALANNRYSADIVAVARAETLLDLPDLPADNALPRWLEEVAGYRVRDLRRRWRLAFDVDGPLELVLAGDRSLPDGADLRAVEARRVALRGLAADPRAELVVSGRTSASTLAWLERAVPGRVRAFVEERGLRAASPLAQAARPEAEEAARHAAADGAARLGWPAVGRRAPASLLGALLEHDGPGSLGDHLARLGEGALVDSRVLLAHRLGADERGWPRHEDRFASDLLLADRIRDPWLRDLTQAAVDAPIPILLGGHSLVGPGVRLLFGPALRAPWT